MSASRPSIVDTRRDQIFPVLDTDEIERADSAIMRTAGPVLEARKKARRLASSRRSVPQDQLDRKIACGRSRRRSPGASQVTAKPQKAVPAGQHTLVSPLPVRTHRPRRAPDGLEAVAAQTRDATRMVRRPDE